MVRVKTLPPSETSLPESVRVLEPTVLGASEQRRHGRLHECADDNTPIHDADEDAAATAQRHPEVAQSEPHTQMMWSRRYMLVIMQVIART